MNTRIRISTGLMLLALLGVSACSKKDPGPLVEYYHPAYRQSPPEPVYGRLTWSHLPAPIKPRVRENAPMLMPEIAMELPKSTLGEAVEALAQSLGYAWTVPAEVSGRKIAIKMSGPVDSIMHELDRQANVRSVLDHDNRTLRVVDPASLAPQLPRAMLSGNAL